MKDKCTECDIEIPKLNQRGYLLPVCETCSKTRYLHPWFERNPDGSYTKPVVGKCSECKERPATKWYAKWGIDFTRGGRMRPWCSECVIKYLEVIQNNVNEQLRQEREQTSS